MKSFKHILLGFSLIGMLAACSSEDNTMPNPIEPETKQWNKIKFSMDVNQGENNSRTTGDLDENKLPRATYPKKLGIYMHRYNNAVEGLITLKEEGTENGGAEFYYNVDKANNKVTLKKTPESAEELTVKIIDYNNNNDLDLFFFASQKQIKNVEFPKVTNNQYEDKFPDAREEFGDKLFCTDGYMFKWKDKEKKTLGLYLVKRQVYPDEEVKEIQEIENWQQENLNILMKRLTACVSIRLMIVDSFKTATGAGNNTVYTNIEGMDSEDIPFEEGVKKTNAAFKKYVSEKHPDLVDRTQDFDIRNLLVRKKVLTNFPTTFDWEDGLKRERGYYKSLYLCNLNYPSWVDDIIDFNSSQNESHIHALTATCSNEPFIATDGQTIPGVELVLFMGIGKRDVNNKPQGGTYNKLCTLTIPFYKNDLESSYATRFQVMPNTHTYFYIGISLENLVELYRILNNVPKPNAARSISDISNVTISPQQVFMTSEPYTSK